MRKAVYIGTAVAAVLILSASARDRSRTVGSPENAAGDFIGTWQLVSVITNGQPDPERGPHPKGLIFYDRTGHMAVQIMPDRARPKFAASEPTCDEAKAALAGYTAYFGTYTVDGRARTVTHHRVGNVDPGLPPDRVRRYEFVSRGRLVLTPVETPDTHLTWERVK